MTDQILSDQGAAPPRRDREALRRALLARRLAGQAGTGAGAERPAADRVPLLPREAALPLSPAQQRIWLTEQLGTGGAAYLVPVALRLRGELDHAALERALTEITARHEVLRTRYLPGDGSGVQAVDPPRPLVPARADLGDCADAERDGRLAALLAQEGERGFDLAAEHPVRALLVTLGEREHLLLLTIHHIAFDGWSAELLTGELTRLYGAFSEHRDSPLPPIRAQYADVAAWQTAQLDTPEGRAQLDHWKQKLAGLAPLQLPTDRPHPPQWDSSGAAVDLDLPADLGRRLVDLGRRLGATPFMTVLAGVQALLSRYSGRPDVAVGTPVAGRTVPESQPLIGLFANTLVLRADTSDDPSFARLVERAREDALAAYANADTPFDLLVKELRPDRDLSRNPLFQVSLTVEAATAPTPAEGTLGFAPEHIGWAPAKFDLAFALQQHTDGSFGGQLGYATALFDRTTAERTAGHLVQLLRAACDAPDEPISGLDLRTPPEREARPAAPAPDDAAPTPIHELIGRQAGLRPDAEALTSGEERTSYRDLEADANRLAHALRARGAGPGSLIGVHLRRGTALVTALLGVLKAGAAYLPLDPDAPHDRLAFMAEDAGVRILLTDRDAGPLDTGLGDLAVLSLDDPTTAADLAARPTDAPATGVGADDLAYVIYTSGSTGRPKGVMVTHRNVARLFTTTRPDFRFGPEDVWTFFHSYAFDFSVWEIWGALVHGGRLVVVPFDVSRSPQDLLDLLARERVTVLNQTPSAFTGLVSAVGADPAAAERLALRTVVFGGEALDPGTLAPWFDRFGDRLPLLVNMYGITETTVHVTHRPMTADDLAAGARSPIGGPIPDLRFHLLDSAMNPVPVGVPGEIHVGGPGVARGYLNRPGLTAERFVPDPFGGEPGARLYRAGDRARLRPDGEIEFLGRIDGQVKIRGFRIELGEIEAALAADPQVEAAVVAVHETATGDRQLVGYLVPAGGAEPDLARLRTSLGRRLPSYMVPAAFVRLDALPLTVNGKVDRCALPDPAADRLLAGREYVLPRTPVESELAEVWGEVLDLGHVGVIDNFFDLGGDSIRAVRVVGRLRERGYDVTVQDLFRRQTVAELAAPLRAAEPAAAPARVEPFALLRPEDRAALPDGLADAYPLSEVQSGMVYEMLADAERLLYHNVTGYLVRDDAPFDPDALRTAVDTVTARHELLRTSFELALSEPLQLVHAAAEVEIRHLDLRPLTAQQREQALREAIRAERAEPFDLADRGPLWRLTAVLEDDRRWRLLFTECHAILDGWSHNSLLTELLQRYRDAREGGPQTDSAPPAVRFADAVALERAALADPEHAAFWAGRVARGEVLTLPETWADPAADAGGYELRVDFADLIPALQQLGRTAGAPLKSVLLAAHLTVLSRLTDQAPFLSGLVTNGRPEVRDGDRLLGMHLNTVPLLSPPPASTWHGLVEAVFAEEVALLPHRRYPLAAVRRGAATSVPPLEVMFNYLNFHVLDEDLLDSDASIDDSPNEFPLAVSTEWGRLVLTFDGRRVARERGELLAAMYTRVLAAMAADPEGDPGRLPLPAAEHAAALAAGPVMAGRPVAARALGELVEEWIRRTPEATALAYGEQTLSYAALGERAGELAGRLAAAGVGRGDRVAIFLPRGIDGITAMLAVSRIGAAFVPLDPAHPQDRLAYVLDDAAVAAAVATAETAARLGIPAERTVLPGDHGHAPAPAVRPYEGDAAYVIYTSGSTGRPKGVVVEHRGLHNLVHAHAELLGVRPGDRVLQFCATVFDVSVLEILMTLGSGATLVLAPAAELLPGEPLAELIRRQRVDHLVTVPSSLALLSPETCAPRTVSVIGEECSQALAARWAPRTRFINLYGPTEYTVVTTGEEIGTAQAIAERPTIGRPLPDTRALVLDTDLRPVPVGVPGELCLGGVGIARGYLGRPDLTADRFVPDPHGDTPGARLYRTGDRARLLADGRIDYLGRLDFQVKIRGFRIELGEIEAVLHRHPDVRHAVVVVRHDGGEPRVVAYLVPGDTAPQDDDLLAFLREQLPEYMMPAHFVTLDELPTTGSGKVDRKALPAPDPRAAATTATAPRTPLERRIAEVFADVLGLETIGVEDDFFRVGGHSLLAMRAVARLRAAAGMDIDMRTMQRHRTVAALAAALDTPGPSADPAGHPDDLVALRQEGTDAPVFAVHPGGGSVHWFRGLAGALAEGRPVAAFEHPGLGDAALAAADVDTLAGRYLAQLREHQPTGPYRLLGWCAGAPIAWEIARRLGEQGERTHLVLLDPIADTRDGDPAPDDLDLFDRATAVLTELRAAPAGERAAELRRLAVPLLQHIVDDGGLVITEDSVDDGYLERVEIWRALRAATVGHRYRPAPLDLDLVAGDELAEAAHQAVGGLGYPEYLRRWERLAGAGLRVHRIPGSHLGVLQPPYLGRLAAALDDIWHSEKEN
ncbi:amino acid adenylation domain-containing protein [Streptomyces sp. TLI_235]|nr:non-ribosomal peptide synthetase [Streptomyces sp. TLI_235]PBC75549.1 amino acid adenylation domain-containing protein [Streptomyces sp. TLI_235]